MRPSKPWATYILAALLAALSISCATTTPNPISTVIADQELVEISILVNFEKQISLPEGSRIVIMDIIGECDEEVRYALMRRLIDNLEYTVLNRDNFEKITGEADLGWGGRFDTERVSRLGRLLGASFFIVGRVGYCGQSAIDMPNQDLEAHFKILATIQIIDLETSRVIFSSASEGVYVPKYARFPDLDDSPKNLPEGKQEGDPQNSAPERRGALAKFFKFIGKIFNSIFSRLDQPEPESPIQAEVKPEPEDYVKIKAAEDMVNGFADKFFSRPVWEKVEMWKDSYWDYGESVRYVQLGRCQQAVQLLESAAKDIPYMYPKDIAKYLHNHGVALLCANQPREAMQKLRAAYRIDNNQTTLKMLGIAAKIGEWSLEVETNKEPIVDGILERTN